MIEQPESIVLSRQLTQTALDKKVDTVVAGAAPHKFAFFEGDPALYPAMLAGRRFTGAEGVGPYVRLHFEDTTLLLRDGVNLRYHAPGQLPAKHQLLITFTDGSALSCCVQMYGAMQAFPAAAPLQNLYYNLALTRPGALDAAFTEVYFMQLYHDAKPALSAKAFLATEQRIPGIGNGVLQDILFAAGIHPQRKLATLSQDDLHRLYRTTVALLQKMADEGGRDTEKDLFGKPGGYKTILSAKTCIYPCLTCGTGIVKKAYLGGSVYFCPTCQPL